MICDVSDTQHDQASPRYHDVSKPAWPPLVSGGPLTAQLTIVGAVSHLTGPATTTSHLNSSDTLWPGVKLRDHWPQLQPLVTTETRHWQVDMGAMYGNVWNG